MRHRGSADGAAGRTLAAAARRGRASSWRCCGVLGTEAFLDGLRGSTARPVLAALAIGLLTTVFSAWRWCWWRAASASGCRWAAPSPTTTGRCSSTRRCPAACSAMSPRGSARPRRRRRRPRGARGGPGADRRPGGARRRGRGGAAARPLSWRPCSAAPSPARVAAVVAGVLLLGTVVAVVVRARQLPEGRWRRALGNAVSDVRAGLLARGQLARPARPVGRCTGGLPRDVPGGGPGGGRHRIDRRPAAPADAGAAGDGAADERRRLGTAGGRGRAGLRTAGLGAPLGVTVAVVYGVLALVASLPGGVVLLARRRAARGRVPVGAGSVRVPLPRRDPYPTPFGRTTTGTGRHAIRHSARARY